MNATHQHNQTTCIWKQSSARRGMYLGLISSFMLIAPAAFAQPIKWLVQEDGDWNTPENWAMGIVPHLPTHLPILVGELPYRVTMNGSFTFGSLSIPNPLAELQIRAGSTPITHGDLLNNGLININPSSGNVDTGLLFSIDSKITGSGTIRLHATSESSDSFIGPVFSEITSVTNGQGHTIAGDGMIGTPFVNQGTIAADGSADSTIHISGLLDAPFIQNENGLTYAKTGNIEIFTEAKFQGGAIKSDPGSHVYFGNDLRLGDVTNQATLKFDQTRRNTITVDGEFTNETALVFQSDDRWSGPEFEVEGEASIMGDGEIVLGAGDYWNKIVILPDSTLTHGQDHTIRGRGEIFIGENSTFINAGTVVAQGKYSRLTLTGTVAGHGEFIAEEGASIWFTARDDEDVHLEDISIHTVGDANAYIRSGVGISNFSNHGNLKIGGPDRAARLGGSILNNGTIEIIDHTTASQDTTLLGNGTIVIGRNELFEIPSEHELFNEAGHTVDLQGGSISGPFLNAGIIKGWGGIAGPFSSNSTIRANGYADRTDYTLSITGDHLSGSGTYDAGKQILRLSACSIARKTFESDDEGVVMFFDTDFTSITNNALLRSYSQLESTMSGSLTNNNTLLITGSDSQSLRFMNSMTIQGSGIIELRGTQPNNPPQLIADGDTVVTINQEHTLLGHGRLKGEFVLQGALDPFKASTVNFIPSISVNNLTFTNTASLHLDLLDAFGQAEHMVIDVNGTLHLGGTLNVNLGEGVVPNIGQWILIAGQDNTHILGEFDQVNFPDTPSNRRYRLRQSDSELVLVLTCPSDFNADLIFDVNDVFAFTNAFGAQSLDADVNNDGVLNFYDVSAFLTDYLAPCQ